MHAESSRRWLRKLTILIPIFALSGCGEGDGPTRIENTAATPLPPGFEEPAPTLGVFSETNIDPVVTIQDIQQAGNEVIITTETVRVFEGAVSLGLTFTTGGLGFGGSTILFDDADVSEYNTLKFSIDVSSFANFANLTVQLEPPPGGTGEGFVFLADYTPVATAGNWNTYEIPLSDLPAVNLALVNKLGFFSARDGGDVLLAGTLYLDDIHFTVTDVSDSGDAGTPIDPEVSLYNPPGDPDLVAQVTEFDSQSVINQMYADDSTYDQVLAVSSGVGSGANVAQVGFIGFDPGFVTFYEDLIFKVKGMPNFVIFVSLYEGGNPVRISLTSPGLSEALGDGWYQVSIPLSSFTGLTTATGIVFESDDTAPMQFTMLLNDVGFSGTAGDGGDTGGGDCGDAVVFDDDYGVGVSFAPFGGSINDVTVDSTEAYSGTASLKVVVPAAEYTGGALVADPARDVSGFDTLTFWAKASAAHTLNVAGIGNDGNDTTNATEVTDLALTTTWTQYTITIPDPSVLTANTGLFHFAEGSDEGVYTIWFDDIIYEASGGGGPVEGNLAVNGDFETGDFAGWAQYPSADTTQTIVVDPTTSSNVARLFIPASAGGVNNVLKQERLLDGDGVFSAGDIVEISFDYRGEPGEGILFVKSICETAEPICGDKLHNNGAPFLPAGWTNYTDTFTLGGGVTGYTLEFAAVCGGTGTCVADYFIDNVSIVIQ